jgi:SpoVK/Ycf46/Vps4 family AAA+-type ATPase
MSKISELLEASYVKVGEIYTPEVEFTKEDKLQAGIYEFKNTMNGIVYKAHTIHTDKLLKFKDPRYDQVYEEIVEFYTDASIKKYKALGFKHSSGVMMEGHPGGGKTSLMKLITEEVKNEDVVTFIVDSAYLLEQGLTSFRKLEPKRKVLVILEEVDHLVSNNHSMRILSELLDGQKSFDNVQYLATTNYYARIPEKFKRPGRFDRKIKIGNPPKEGRLAYLKDKIGMHESDSVLEKIADKTDDFTFAEMRELVRSMFINNHKLDTAIKRIKSGLEEALGDSVTEKELVTFLRRKYNSHKPVAVRLMEEFEDVKN